MKRTLTHPNIFNLRTSYGCANCMVLFLFICFIASALASCDKDSSNETKEKILTHEDSLALGLIVPPDTTSTHPQEPSTPPTVNEIETTIDGIIYKLNEDNHTAKVWGVDGEDTKSILIPESVHYNNTDYPVVTIGDGAFYYKTKIEKVKIKGENLKVIESMAFAKCFRLGEINFPNSITEISHYAFHNCGLDGSISLPKSLKTIGKAAFRVCALTSVDFPDNLETIGDEAFYSTKLEDLIIPKVKNIGAYAFQNCASLKSIKIHSGLERIGEKAFENCRKIREVYIPKTLQSIEEEAFSNCVSIDKVMIEDVSSWCHLSFPSSSANPLIKGSRLFNFKDEEITEIVIPEDMSSIGKYVFAGCKSIKKVTIPENISLVGYGAFMECNNMEFLSLSKNINEIENYAFYNCKIPDIYCYATKVPKTGSLSFYGGESRVTLHVPYQSVSLYRAVEPYKYFGSIVGL